MISTTPFTDTLLRDVMPVPDGDADTIPDLVCERGDFDGAAVAALAEATLPAGPKARFGADCFEAIEVCEVHEMYDGYEVLQVFEPGERIEHHALSDAYGG